MTLDRSLLCDAFDLHDGTPGNPCHDCGQPITPTTPTCFQGTWFTTPPAFTYMGPYTGSRS